MYMKAKVSECDMNGIQYDSPVDGAWILSQGATGRVCAVMYVGPEYIAAHGLVTITREQAEAQVVDYPQPAWVDF